jgi:Fuc2NAc and GlcNAc transferase
MPFAISTAVFAILSTIGASWVLRNAGKLGLIDAPNDRSSHSIPTARGLGLPLALATALTAAIFYSLGDLSAIRATTCLVAAFAVGGIGFVDDSRGVPISTRFSIHAISSLIVVFLLLPLPYSDGHIEFAIDFLAVTVTLVWALNSFNFMDGIDGLALQQALFLSLGALVLLRTSESEWPPLLLGISVGAMILLRWNWAPARAFLGDVGSGFLGFTFGAIAVDTIVSGDIAVESWLILWGIFLVDSTVTLTTRVLTGQNWYHPHCLHTYQRLARRWGSHARVTIMASCINMLWLLPWAILSQAQILPTGICVAVALSPLVLIALILRAGVSD